jgi:acetoin utilization protein AcuB
MAVPVLAITPKTGIATALRLLREHGAGALPVLDGARFIGLVDEAALLRFTPSEATTLDVYELREVLERLPVARAIVQTETVAPGAPLSAAVAAMCRARARVLPVVDKGRLVGLLPWTRLLAAASGEPGQLRA